MAFGPPFDSDRMFLMQQPDTTVRRAFELLRKYRCFVFLGIGAAKSRWSMQSWWASALETFIIGMSAAGIAYAIGLGLKALVQV